MDYKIIETKERVLADNDAAAEATRALMRKNGTLLVNLMGSPGAGKTSVLLRLIALLGDRYRIGVMEADVDSDVDAKTVAAAGVRVIQLHTAGLCHMDADMTARGIAELDVGGLDLLFLENIGNLVCPAEFEIGADLRMMLLSVPEGDDKPLKYPLMFTVSDLILFNKIDTAPIFDFDADTAAARIRALNADAVCMPVSAKTGEGMEAVAAFLEARIAERRAEA
ncbi:MAG: hydrogenase nickel incorporation protein HypB [Clostridia bacterium]|nr:hydrogenase nickel incorporation protein HypB [Clostridia bacterium]MBR0510206.1 hydrogenase nickel incorporation protein HypB [Clostridia bacterium]MBR0537413.1 hydrogenase nickel incorporation protein HypB [Clostridia bacterium]